MEALNPVPDYQTALSRSSRRWLVTGSAGFIGSHLLEALLRQGQTVISLDNFSTGHRANLDEVRALVDAEAWRRHTFVEADITDAKVCLDVCSSVDIVLHQAALGSVPRSIEQPLVTHAANATGFLNLLDAARLSRVGRFVYAASSSTYGDDPRLPKREPAIGRPLSPYAVTKYLNELYAEVYARCYGIETVGLRYFNVFGARQDPDGAYAAVIPRWINEMLAARPCVINGDGETTRDFSYIANVVQANLRAATAEDPAAVNQVYNVACGESITLNELHGLIAQAIASKRPEMAIPQPVHGSLRAGDVRHSLADIDKATRLLGYSPSHSVRSGLVEAIGWYLRELPSSGKRPQ